MIDCPPLSEPVYVDRDMWEKIVLNLISNAFKFTLVGNVTVSLRALADRIELCVRDTGLGIPEDQQSKVFERFQRLPTVGGRTHEGSGIGLALVQELVKLHGGCIHVESAVRKGSVFTVSVPKGCAHLPADRSGSQERIVKSTGTSASAYVDEALRWLPEPKPGTDLQAFASDSVPGPHLPTANGSILIADDNADMRGYVRRLLGDYNVQAVDNGMEALIAIRNHHPDLVLTDVMMSELDGVGLLREIRRDPSLNTIPVILLSARAGERARVEGMEAGADDYIVKPFTARELLARVGAHLAMGRLRQEKARAEQRLAHSERLAAVGTLAGGVAHFFNNEMHIIQLTCSLLQQSLGVSGPSDAVASDYIKGIENASRRSSEIAGRLLRFAQDEVLRPSRFDPRSLLEEVIPELRLVAGEKIEVTTFNAAPASLVELDAARLKEAIFVIVRNARDAMPEGGKLSISLREERLDILRAQHLQLSPSTFVLLSFADTGSGMDDDTLRHVFEPFFTTKGRANIEGLGLASAYGFIRQSGGTITVRSTPKQGSTFELYLPTTAPQMYGTALGSILSQPGR